MSELTRQRRVGDRLVGAVAIGTSSLSLDNVRDDERSIRTIRDAIEHGVTLIDTAHAYTTLDEPSHAENLVRRAVSQHPDRERLTIATKGGHWRAGNAEFPIDGRPATLRAHLELSLRALEIDCIDLYQLHHPDPATPIEESVGALADFQQAGLVRMIGISNCDLELTTRALAVAPLASVQNQLSPFRTVDLPLIEFLERRGIAYLSHSAFGGTLGSAVLGDALPETSRVAESHDCSVQQVVLAWQLGFSPSIIPVVGARRSASIIASIAAREIELTKTELDSVAAEFEACSLEANA